MKFISWNVNGLRACVQKGFLDFFTSIDADFFCIHFVQMTLRWLTCLYDGLLRLRVLFYHRNPFSIAIIYHIFFA